MLRGTMNEANAAPAPARRKGEETKDRILAAARFLIHQRGYKNTGLAEILEASGVPRGSFYFYFKSKEELGKELLLRYRQALREDAETNLFPPASEVIPQFLAFYRQTAHRQSEHGCQSGCLIGNLAAEITDVHEDLRREVAATFLEMKDVFAGALRRGQASGELAQDFAAAAAADFLLSAIEGTVLVAKARREPGMFEAGEVMLDRYLETLRNPARKGHRATIGGQA
jgi:TetR/AcrR family transcriptional repressor of nem operon